MSYLDIDFLSENTLEAAKQLLGKKIATYTNGVKTSGYITEVEAYLGTKDRAAHTFSGVKNKKNSTMFQPYGHIYVYTMHGHHCMNFVTTKDLPEGILIRGIEPAEGIDEMISRRGREANLTDGPGKLTQALGVKRDTHNGKLLNEGHVDIFDGKIPKEIVATKRIGIDNKKEAVDYLYRFIVKGNKHVSRFKGKQDENNGWQ
ncbi:MAG TPA: DNA-3-methyladenine glycosylase [Candidatus Nosocomiicoccus stercorigallinarum]|nr:DNA-3-methyladenine glycosylase [Candidatus Nosocomiicoccus stercorigallinarum]